jgi:hypothetical protein
MKKKNAGGTPVPPARPFPPPSHCVNEPPSAALQYLPPGLAVGDTFQIAFLTTDASFACSPNIGDYNGFVQNDWNKYGPSMEVAPWLSPAPDDIAFSCICSVSGNSLIINAQDNVGPVPNKKKYRGIYRLDGQRCARWWEDLWNGTALEHPINIKSDTSTGDPSGSFCTHTSPYKECSGNVWTGSNTEGKVPETYSWWALGPRDTSGSDPSGHITGVSWVTQSVPGQYSWLGGDAAATVLLADVSSGGQPVKKHFYALSELLTLCHATPAVDPPHYYAINPATGCYDCGVYNVLGVSAENCCPRPANAPTPLPTDCCPYQYKKRGLIVCYKKTKYNTPYHVSGAQGPAKFRKMPGNYTGRQLRHTRIQRGRWNHSLSNTKLFPIISECRDTNGNLTSVQQSKNIYTNTDYKMPKHELMSYLMRNRKYLHR